MFNSCQSSKLEREVQNLNKECPIKVDIMGVDEITSIQFNNNKVIMFSTINDAEIDWDFFPKIKEVLTSNILAMLMTEYNAKDFLKALSDEKTTLVLNCSGPGAGNVYQIAFDEKDIADFVKNAEE